MTAGSREPPAAGLRLRPGRPGDLEAVLALVLDGFAAYSGWAPAGWRPPEHAMERPRWAPRLEGEEHRVELAEDADGRILAMSSWTAHLDPRPAPEEGARDAAPYLAPGRESLAHLNGLFVSSEQRGAGLGSLLLGRAEAAMRAAGITRAQLWTPERADARFLYERRGWTLDGRRQLPAELGLVLVAYAKELG